MSSLGVDPAAYDTGVTSGDATRALIESWAGRRLLHIGPQRDLGLFAGLGVEAAPAAAAEARRRRLHRGPQRDLGLFAGLGVEVVPAEAAEAIVCSGLFDDTRETPADYD